MAAEAQRANCGLRGQGSIARRILEQRDHVAPAYSLHPFDKAEDAVAFIEAHPRRNEVFFGVDASGSGFTIGVAEVSA